METKMSFMFWLGFMCMVPVYEVVSAQGGFRCSASMQGKTCDALALLRVEQSDNPSIADIAALFQLKDSHDILGANNWPPSLSLNTRIPKGSALRVPIQCGCSVNGTGIAVGIVYTVKPGDFLSVIAMDFYGGLVTYEAIASVNNISDPNEIDVDQKFTIPLPCFCSVPASANSVIDYTYVVGKGDTLQEIASSVGSTVQDISAINSNVSSLTAGQVIVVPLKACLSNFSKASEEQNLLVANGSYAFSAERCVQCNCLSSNLTLHCAAGPLNASCSGMKCKNSNLDIGSVIMQSTRKGCNVTECLYDGYENKTVYTLLENRLENQCPAKHGKHGMPGYANPPLEAAAPSPGSTAAGPSSAETPSPFSVSASTPPPEAANGPSSPGGESSSTNAASSTSNNVLGWWILTLAGFIFS